MNKRAASVRTARGYGVVIGDIDGYLSPESHSPINVAATAQLLEQIAREMSERDRSTTHFECDPAISGENLVAVNEARKFLRLRNQATAVIQLPGETASIDSMEVSTQRDDNVPTGI